jgi:hypothetical protein
MATSYAMRGAVEDRGPSFFVRAWPLPQDETEMTFVDDEPPTLRRPGASANETPVTKRPR